MELQIKQLVMAIKQIAEEKNLPEETVHEAVEQALAAAYRKDFGEREQNVAVQLNENTGEMTAITSWDVVADDEVENDAQQLTVAQAQEMKKDAKARMETLKRDVASIDEHAAFLSAKVSFLLDATLGLINIEQNAIIKIFTVAAVAFLPPTLIASIYGMNFEFMPELHWQHGYLVAIGMMVLSAVLPFWYFRKRGWL